MRVAIQCMALIKKVLDMLLLRAGLIKECARPGKIEENEQESLVREESLSNLPDFLGHVCHLNPHSQLPADVFEHFIPDLFKGVGVIFLAMYNLTIEGCLADSFGPDDTTSLEVVVLL